MIETVACKRILIIDDDDHIRKVVGACLRTLGRWEVILAASGQEALAKVEAEKPDAIVLDVEMPQMDGIVFLKRLRANPQFQTIPVVLLTGTLLRPQQLAALGVRAAIAKPFNPLTLTTQIATACGWSLTPDR